MKTQILFLLLPILSLIYTSELNNTTVNFNTTEDFGNEEEYPISEEEKDKILFCTVIWQTKQDEDRKNIQDLITELNITDEDLVYNKIGVDLLKSCLDKVKLSEVRKYFNNLTYFKEVESSNYHLKNAKIDFEGYRKKPMFNLSIEEEILAFKFHKTMELFEIKKREENFMRDNERNEELEKVKIGKLDINNIPKTVNIILFLIVFGSLFGGTLYFIKSMNKKKEPKKKKKNKQN